MKQKVYIMCGIPGSGKSTWISNNLDKNIKIISRDIIRYKLGYVDNPDEKVVLNKEQENHVTQIEYKLINNYLSNGESIVIDDINSGKYRNKLINELRKYNVHIIGVNLITPLDKCIKRRINQINPNILSSIQKRLIPITKDEVDELININN
jgi:predicted kinase